jgi:FKBP-type peptidyl-prolyl cis-trans isomerase
MIKCLPIAYLFFCLFFVSCKQDNQNQVPQDLIPDKQQLTTINKYVVEQNDQIIDKYIERRNWNMEKQQNGLRYMIYKKGNGEQINEGDKVILNYSVELLDGSVCYSSAESGPKHFIVGKGEVESGLDKGIRLLQEGDCATFILPPHLAHGLLGDEKRIPANATLVYDVKVKQVIK